MFLLLLWCTIVSLTSGIPSMRDTLTNPVHVYEGDDALITCVVKNIGRNTVMWKKEDKERYSTRVLTAGENRVTADKRYGVLHDSDEPAENHDSSPDLQSGGDVWVLVIENVKPSDAGVYVCEVNSSPIVRSFHKLSVISKSLPLPNRTMTDITIQIDDQRQLSSKNHNYTDCCISKNVSTSCIGFCNIQSILEGTTGQDPEQCETDFPAIVSCMADGRNHVPCCIQERVPDICQDVCRGEYTAITDDIRTHFSCSSFTEQTLACIVEGIELLPSPPEIVEVEALTEKSIKVQWSWPLANTDTITEYHVNVTSLKSFDERILEPEVTTSKNSSSDRQMTIVKVPFSENMTILQDLTPFTMYEISVTAVNRHGTSLPSYTLRSLTLTSGNMKNTRIGQAPNLPDIKSCCINKGIVQKTCRTKLCDPTLVSSVEITDLMICAPWAADTFGCLANGIDHTPCCKARGLPDICQHLCTGNMSSLDFNYFKCLRYMEEYNNCLLQGYGVLPSAPTGIYVTNIETEFAVIHWSTPKTLGDTVLYYNIHQRMIDDETEEYKTIPKVQSPHILGELESESDYEVYVEAVNVHGIGMPSSRLTFRTESKIFEEKIEESDVFNTTSCCIQAQVNTLCIPLCSSGAKMSDIKALSGVCSADFHKMLKCGVAGRNHAPCCSRRGVPDSCLGICTGVLLSSPTCFPYIGNMVLCFGEGNGLIPGPISALHAVIVDEHSIMLEWNQPENSTNITGYVIHYQKVDNSSMHGTSLKLDKQINSTNTAETITDLEEGSTYQMFVVAINEYGTSLPSSIIMINLVKSDQSKWVDGVTSPPHSLAVASHSATWVTITWHPPEFSHPLDIITYRLYHKSASEEQFHVKNVSVNSYMIDSLNPNTKYIVYIRAVTNKGVSTPSETLIAWTDPAYPAFVEPPTVHPINLVIEGSSMTILCIAMGTPMPTISLYLSGRLVRQETTRHMVTVVHNVTKDMDQISCYADNGYGTPMQASRKITISHGPHIQASGITMTTLGDSVTLECKVEAQPEPKMIFWRNHEERSPVIQGGKYDISTRPVKDELDKYVMQLTIKQIQDADVGDYYCHAENAFGSSTKPVSVRIRNLAAYNNVTQCCIEQNVTSACMDACTLYLDIDAVIDKPECIQDFDKLMKCAADGSDHRSCCAQQNVPRRCLDWCRGEPVLNNKICVLSYTKVIMSCFHEGRDKLPGPPQNVHVDFIDSHSVEIIWDPPAKNSHTVELYRVIIRAIDSPTIRDSFKEDTPDTRIKIQDLIAGATYQVVVKAGNSKGTSTLTEPLKFTMGDRYITSAASQGGQDGHVGVIIAVISALAFVGAIFAGAVWFVRSKKMLRIKSSNGIAFENPSYLREVNMDHIQVPQGQTEPLPISNGTANGIAVSSSSGGTGWKNESLQVPAQHEVDPSLYEELKLGQDGAGFKRLKP